MDGGLPRDVDLPGGERLRFRETRPDDAGELEALFERLDSEARYRRFFTAAGPAPDYGERLSRVAERGGVGVVAVDVSDTGPDAATDGRIVAEADAELLDNGNAEIAVTVDRAWRGWVGPYLLSLLREEAARRGIASLEAEILTSNPPMRALTRSCGEALLPQPDWQTVRVVIGSDGTTPSWPSTTKPTVLVELRTASVEALAQLVDAGYEVLACTGRTRGGPPCPMLTDDGDCSLAQTADVVVVAVPDPEEQQRLVDLHRRRHPHVPVVPVEVGPGHPMSAAVLVDAAERGLAMRLDPAEHR
mgnify:CR=1 FL=1